MGGDNLKNGGGIVGASLVPALPVPSLPALPKKKILPFLDVGSIKPLKGLNRSSSHEVPPVTARPRRRYIPRTKSMRLSSSPPPTQQQVDISPLRSCQRGGGIIAEDATDRSTGTDDTSLGSSFGSNLTHGYSSSGGWRSPFGGIGGSGTSSAPRKRVRFSRSIKVINRPRHPSPLNDDVNYDLGEQPQWVDVDDNVDDHRVDDHRVDASSWVTKRNPDELMMSTSEEEGNDDDSDTVCGKVALQEAYLSDSLFLFERMGGTPMTHHTPLIHQKEPSKYFSSLAAGLDEGHRGVERWCGVVGRERQQKIDAVRRYVIDQHAKLVRQQQQPSPSSSSSSPSSSSSSLSKDEAVVVADLVRAASLQGSAYSGRLAYFYGQVDALAVADKPSSLMMIVCMRTCLPPPSSSE